MSELDECRRATTDLGPDYCAPCSEFLGEWVKWGDHRPLVRAVAFLRERVDELER